MSALALYEADESPLEAMSIFIGYRHLKVYHSIFEAPADSCNRFAQQGTDGSKNAQSQKVGAAFAGVCHDQYVEAAPK